MLGYLLVAGSGVALPLALSLLPSKESYLSGLSKARRARRLPTRPHWVPLMIFCSILTLLTTGYAMLLSFDDPRFSLSIGFSLLIICLHTFVVFCSCVLEHVSDARATQKAKELEELLIGKDL